MGDDGAVNPSSALATVIVAALADLGVRQVVLCPGSRSAPLAYALADAADAGRLRLHVRIDERSAGFLALGLARAADAPAAVVTTSGTAVANLHPAVLEASHAGVPLLVISADRPHELRGTGANQAADQVRMFGPAARWYAEIPAPHRAPGQVAGWRNVVARAVAAARGNPGSAPGPVQLDVAFADPLLPDGPGLAGSDGSTGADGSEGSGGWPEPLAGTAGLTAVAPALDPVPVRLPWSARTVVLAGDGAGPEAARVAAAGGWPLLAEPSSGARTAAAIGAYRLLLDLPELGGAIERVLVFGRPTLSRPVSRLLARSGPEIVVVSRRPDWTDPGRLASLVVPAVAVDPPAGGDPDRPARNGEQRHGGWLASWRAAGRAASAAIDRLLDAEAEAGRLTGPLVAREVAAATGAGDLLVAGASNPIRDLDLAAGPFAAGARVLANRGLAGIDGTLSTASGAALARAAAGERGRVRCLVGDLTFLHDAGALLVGPLEEPVAVQVTVLDDGGGGIFGLLEHGARAGLGEREKARFERLFGTPQDADLAALCAGYGVAHQLVDDPRALRSALRSAPGSAAGSAPGSASRSVPGSAPGTGGSGTSVIQVRVDRAAQRDLAERIRVAAVDAARRALSARPAPARP